MTLYFETGIRSLIAISLIGFVFLTGSVSASPSRALVPLFDLLLSNDQTSNPPSAFPRRRDFGTTATFDAINGNLVRLNANNSVATLQYDATDRLINFSTDVASNSNDNVSITFVYESLSSDDLRKIEIDSFTELGTRLSSEINFFYTPSSQLSALTNATFEGAIGSEPEDESVFTIDVDYTPVYENGRLTTINKSLTNNLPPPLGGTFSSSITIRYAADGRFFESVDTGQEGGQSVGRRINVSPTRQEVVRQLIAASGLVISSDTQTADYEDISCTDSNRLVDRNFLILNLFTVPSVNAFLQPTICRD